MTWRELYEHIPENKLDTDVTIYDSYEEEYYPMSTFSWDNIQIVDGGFYIIF